jgi:hypothetical protein
MICSIKKENIFVFFPIIFMLFPVFPTIFQGYTGINLIFILEIIFVFIAGSLGIFDLKFSAVSCIYFCIFFVLILFSILFDLVNGILTISDLYEIIKPVAFLLFYTFYRKANVNIKTLEENTKNIVVILFFLMSLYCIFEFFFPEIIRPISYFLYKRENLPALRNKAIGSFQQTYQFAFILLLPLIYSYTALLKRISVTNICFFSIILFSFLLTQSRSMYITLCCTFLIILCLPYMYKKRIYILKIWAIVLIIAALIINIYIKYQDELRIIFSYAINGLENMSEGNNNSVNTRSDQIGWAIAHNSIMLIGQGISKKVFFPESFYALYYYRYGLIGIIAYLLLPILTAATSYKIAKKEYSNKISTFYFSLAIFYLITPIGILSSCHQDTPKISLLFYGLMGLVFHKNASIKKQSRCKKYNAGFAINYNS